MLTDLSWLSPGAPYPPAAEKNRIERYDDNEKLFLTEHCDVWKDTFDTLARRLKRTPREVNTILNYQQLLSKKTADFVCGEPPTLDGKNDMTPIERLLAKQQFGAKLYEAFLDVSRFGNGIPKLVGKNITLVNPKYWFPVVDPADIKTIVQHVIAYPITPGKDGNMTELYAEIHRVGSVETRVYAYDPVRRVIGQPKQDPKTVPSGIADFAVQPLTNLTCSSSVFGIDDYGVINSLVQKIMWRLHCADLVLDKHSEPSMSGPSSALSYDERKGEYFLDLGNYFKRNDPNDPDLKYITWDGNIDANFKELELLFNQLYTLSEMGQAFSEAAGGTADSGEALKLRMVSPRIKAQRLTGINTATVKAIIGLLGQVNGIPVDIDTLTLHWNDGLPEDEKEQTDMLVSATGGKAIMSQFAAMKQRGLSDEEVEAELEQMREEQAAATPPVLREIDLNSSDLPPEDTGGPHGGDA